jgi:drug/metabolite transporter (DMT)-like permease
MHKGVIYALLAAALFGASTPFAKLLVGAVPPLVLAGMLYLGSGLGLLAWLGLRALRKAHDQDRPAGLTTPDLPWLAGAILAGGITGPVLLMVGLALTPASSASLLLNMEGVLTSMLAWFVFKENFDRRIFIGMLFIVVAGIVLSWEQVPALGTPTGALAVVGACLCWAIDNNLTRKVSASDAVQIACAKGLVAGIVNLGIAGVLGFGLPDAKEMLGAAAVGFSGYGLSLAMFVVALRHLGSARTGAYFSVAPFVGAAISLLVFAEMPTPNFWLAAGLMGVGVWLHLTERHEHEHVHEPLYHAHAHVHDEHHWHEHDVEWEGTGPHTHPHRHAPIRHTHAHYPDIHHRHGHRQSRSSGNTVP